MLNFNTLAKIALTKKASDLHLTANMPAVCRIDGALVPVTDEILSPDDISRIAKELMSPLHYTTLKEKGETDFAHSVEGVGRFRINLFTQKESYAMAARLLNTNIPTPEDIKLPKPIINMCDKRRGLVLVTGVTGSGKSTTLASLINEINTNQSRHVITLEDPIEYVHTHKKSIVNQREVGSDTLSFPNALRAALRQDPDVILVGEMRDLETISIAVTAAETGHLVFSTLHTVGAANTVDRIIDVFPPHQQEQVRIQLADVLECVVSQQLIPTVYGGRTAAFEIMLSNSAIKNHIRDGKTYQIPSSIQTNAKMGMKTMDDAIIELYQKGEITRENAMLFAQDRVEMNKRIF